VTGQIPTEMLKSVFIAIPKKSNTLDWENHRTISLMAHTQTVSENHTSAYKKKNSTPNPNLSIRFYA